MSFLQSLQLEHLPEGYTAHLAMFHDAKNAGFLHEQLLAGNSEFEYAFMDASIIVSRLHLLAAAFRAVNDSIENRLKTRNVHSEIVFCLSPNNNIAESFRRFGVSKDSNSILAIKITTPESTATSESIQAHLAAHVEGRQVEPSDDEISSVTDIARVRKLYKLPVVQIKGAKKEKTAEEAATEKKELETCILAAMALRGAT